MWLSSCRGKTLRLSLKKSYQLCLSWLHNNSEVTLNAGSWNNCCQQICSCCYDILVGFCQEKHYVDANFLYRSSLGCCYRASVCFSLIRRPCFHCLLHSSLWRAANTLKVNTHPAEQLNVRQGADPSLQPPYVTKEWLCFRSLIMLTIVWGEVGVSCGSLLVLAAAGNTQAVSTNMKLF